MTTALGTRDSVDALVEHVDRATTDVFAMMLGREVQIDAADDDVLEVPGLVATLDITGDAPGSIAVLIGNPDARRLTAAMLGEPPSNDTADVGVSDDVRDAVGELGNLIVGRAKVIASDDQPFEMSLPRVTDAVASRPQWSSSTASRTLHAVADDITFAIRIAVRPAPAA